MMKLTAIVMVALMNGLIVESRFPKPMVGGYSPAKYNRLDRRQSNFEGGERIRPGGRLVFEDNFNELNLDVWRHEITAGGGGNWEFQFYNNNRSTSYIDDGCLVLKPVLTSEFLGIPDENMLKPGQSLDLWGNAPNFQCTANGFYGCQRSGDGVNTMVNPIMSAQLRSHQAFNFKFGRVDVRAKLPKGDWLWPAIWFLPSNFNYGGWPASGEIDLVESRGNRPGYFGDGVDTMASTLHWGTDYMHNQYNLTTKAFKLQQGTFADDFHTFSLEWTPTKLRTWVDEVNLVLDVDLTIPAIKKGKFDDRLHNPWKGASTAAPFDQKFYLIFNLAVGGSNSYFPDDPRDIVKSANGTSIRRAKGSKPWKNFTPNAAVDFYKAKEEWYPTWNQPGGAEFRIDYVKAYSYEQEV